MFAEERIVVNHTLREIKPTKLQKAKDIGIFGLYVVIGALFGFFLTFFLASSEHEYTLSIYGVVLMFIICMLTFGVLHIALHELGHVIMGKLTGYGFYSYRLFSFLLIKEDGKWHIKKYSVPGTLGQAIMVPPEKKDGEFPWFWYNLGGGLMNIVSSLIALVIYLVVPIKTEWVGIMYLTFILTGIVLGATNLIPGPSGKIANDGSNILAMFKDSIARECFYKQLNTVAILSNNGAFHDQPLEAYQLPKEADLTCMLIAVLKNHEMEYYYDVEDYDKVIQLLNELEEDTSIAKTLVLNMDMERLFIECMQGPREEVVKTLYTKQLNSILHAAKNVPDMQRTLMAYEGLYMDNYDEALKCYTRACELLDKYPMKGVEVIERRLLEMAKQRIEEKRANTD